MEAAAQALDLLAPPAVMEARIRSLSLTTARGTLSTLILYLRAVRVRVQFLESILMYKKKL